MTSGCSTNLPFSCLLYFPLHRPSLCGPCFPSAPPTPNFSVMQSCWTNTCTQRSCIVFTVWRTAHNTCSRGTCTDTGPTDQPKDVCPKTIPTGGPHTPSCAPSFIQPASFNCYKHQWHHACVLPGAILLLMKKVQPLATKSASCTAMLLMLSWQQLQ